MPLEFDPSAIRAELKTEDDHWVVAIETATAGNWGHADTSWRSQTVSGDEIGNDLGDNHVFSDEDVIAYIETSLRRAGWRAARKGETVSSPVLEIWDLSPASEYGRPRHLFS
jgi:hypothetical protein